MSSTGTDDVCPICLCTMTEEFSRPENCQHRFDLECLTEWAKLRLSCPSCRATFSAVYSYKFVEAKPILHKVQRMEPPTEAEPFDETNPLDFTVCEICSGGAHEELLLICDQCDKGFHTYCLTPPLDSVPTSEQWFCPQCEESRMDRPSTSHSMPSARTIRLVQRTALAERVRRILARNRHLVDSDESSTEEDDDVDDDDEEEEDRELVASSEDEVNEFSDDDARVLVDIEVDHGGPSLPSVNRRNKKKRNVKKTSKKTRVRKLSKKPLKRKRRKNKNVHRKNKIKRDEPLKESLISSMSRRGGPREPVTRLSLLGAELEPIADPLVTENSRRFDQPLCHRKESLEDEKPVVDSCDLLGSIIPEQMKTLAPGRLFAIKGGRFSSTEYFEKYKRKKTNQLSLELRERLGMTADSEEPSNSTKIKESVKAKYSSDPKVLSVPGSTEQSTSSSIQFMKPEKTFQSKGGESGMGGQLHLEDRDSSFLRRHHSLNQKPCETEEERRIKHSTSKYPHRYHSDQGSRKESLPEEVKFRKDNCQRWQDLDQSHPGKHVHPYQDNNHLSCGSSKLVQKNEESEQEDRSNSMNPALDERAFIGHRGCADGSMPEFQTSSIGPSVSASSEMCAKFRASESQDSKNKSDDILKIIDGFAKEGIRPYKREITVEEYKDVMRAVVRECYKKKILDANEIKVKVKGCVEALKRGEPLLFGFNSSKRPASAGHIESTLPAKRIKPDS